MEHIDNKSLKQFNCQRQDVEDPGATLTAYDVNGNLIEMISITPQAQSGLSHFYGIEHEGIKSIIVGTSSSEGIAVDDLTYTTKAPVPEPATLLFMALGFGGFGIYRRKKSA